MFKESGELLGWILVVAFTCTILNYCLKLVNKRFSKKIAAYPAVKKTMKILMAVFVRNHRYFGIAAAVALLAHFAAQYSMFGINITGFIAAAAVLSQVLLGVYATVKKRPRKGAWFVAHRSIAVLIILGIALHLIAPYAFNGILEKEDARQESESADDSELRTFTLDELSRYNGENGSEAYVAYKGFVYDVTEIPAWKNGKHNGHKAGTDLTDAISKAPHGDSVIEDLEVVGKVD